MPRPHAHGQQRGDGGERQRLRRRRLLSPWRRQPRLPPGPARGLRGVLQGAGGAGPAGVRRGGAKALPGAVPQAHAGHWRGGARRCAPRLPPPAAALQRTGPSQGARCTRQRAQLHGAARAGVRGTALSSGPGPGACGASLPRAATTGRMCVCMHVLHRRPGAHERRLHNLRQLQAAGLLAHALPALLPRPRRRRGRGEPHAMTLVLNCYRAPEAPPARGSSHVRCSAGRRPAQPAGGGFLRRLRRRGTFGVPRGGTRLLACCRAGRGQRRRPRWTRTGWWPT